MLLAVGVDGKVSVDVIDLSDNVGSDAGVVSADVGVLGSVNGLLDVGDAVVVLLDNVGASGIAVLESRLEVVADASLVVDALVGDGNALISGVV